MLAVLPSHVMCGFNWTLFLACVVQRKGEVILFEMCPGTPQLHSLSQIYLYFIVS